MRKEEKAVFAISEDRSVVVIGLSEEAISYMKADPGISHTFDLRRFGVPLRLMIFYGKDTESIHKTLNITEDTLDVSNVDVSFGMQD